MNKFYYETQGGFLITDEELDEGSGGVRPITSQEFFATKAALKSRTFIELKKREQAATKG